MENTLSTKQANILTRLKNHKLDGMAEMLDNIFSHPSTYGGLPLEDLVELCLDEQEHEEQLKRYNILLKKARLPDLITIDDIKPDPVRGITQDTLVKLVSLN